MHLFYEPFFFADVVALQISQICAVIIYLIFGKLVWCGPVPISPSPHRTSLLWLLREDGEIFCWKLFLAILHNKSLCLLHTEWYDDALLASAIFGASQRYLRMSQLQAAAVGQSEESKETFFDALRDGDSYFICALNRFNFWVAAKEQLYGGHRSRRTIWGCGSFPSRHIDLWTRSGSSKHVFKKKKHTKKHHAVCWIYMRLISQLVHCFEVKTPPPNENLLRDRRPTVLIRPPLRHIKIC